MKFLRKYNKNGNAIYIYGTRCYIVEQEIYLDYMPDGSSILYGRDTYYLKNRKLDKHYENMFCKRENINGNRIYVGLFKSKYV